MTMNTRYMHNMSSTCEVDLSSYEPKGGGCMKKQKCSPVKQAELGNSQNDFTVQTPKSAKQLGGGSFRRSLNNLKKRHASEESTPTRSVPISDPNTPSSNFKLLSSVAASLDYVENSISNECLSEKSTDCSTVSCTTPPPRRQKSLVGNRKEKSLSLICERFLAAYPSVLPEEKQIFICLDQAANHLGVERRRIYDIVNVLECLGMVHKIGKNKYEWHGTKNFIPSLQRLKTTALSLGFKEKVQNYSEFKENHNIRVVNDKDDNSTSSHSYNDQGFVHGMRKERSLGALSERFLMIFLILPKAEPISLDTVAKLLLDDADYSKEHINFKAKIRRLYDVANIFMSLGLLSKESLSRKQGFKYVGPDLTDAPETFDIHKRSPLKYSKVEKYSSNSGSAHVLQPKLFKRHSSFQDICAVAEIERQKLYASDSLADDADSCSSSKINSSLFENQNSSDSAFSDTPVESQEQDQIVRTVPLIFLQPLVMRSNVADQKNMGPDASAKLNMAPNTISKHSGFFQKVILLPQAAQRQLQKKYLVQDLVPKEVPSVSNAPSVITLTSEQQYFILNSLNVPMSKDQEASILISRKEEKEVGKNSPNDATASSEVHPSACVTGVCEKEASCVNNPAQSNEFKCIETDTSPSNSVSCGIKASNSDIANDVSPFSIPSGYATPSVSNMGEPAVLSTQVVSDILDEVEHGPNDGVVAFNECERKCVNIAKSISFANTGRSAQSSVNSSSQDMGKEFLFQSDSSSESSNQEIKAILHKKRKRSQSCSKHDEKPYLIDEKTRYSPIAPISSESVSHIHHKSSRSELTLDHKLNAFPHTFSSNLIIHNDASTIQDSDLSCISDGIIPSDSGSVGICDNKKSLACKDSKKQCFPSVAKITLNTFKLPKNVIARKLNMANE